MLNLHYPFFVNITSMIPAPPAALATAVQLGDLAAGAMGSIVPHPRVNANGSYKSITWSTSDVTILDISSTPPGIKLVAPGTASLTVTLKDAAGATLATVTKAYTIAAPVPSVFTAQPVGALFQDGGKLEITGAAAAPVTVWQWQKLQADGTTWADLPSQTAATLTILNATDADEGTYRVLAINGAASGVASNPVLAVSGYIYIQNDVRNPDLDTPSSDATDPKFVKVDNYHYLMDGPAGGYYVGAFLRVKNGYKTIAGGSVGGTNFAPGANVPADQLIMPGDFGVTKQRAAGATWTGTDESVIQTEGTKGTTPIDNPDGGLTNTTIHAGHATATCTWHNLTSILNVDF